MNSTSDSHMTATTDSLQYTHYQISSLVPGPIRARFTGTVVNIFGYSIDSTAPKAAKGCLKLLLRDNSGEILVKLWYAEAKYEEEILLGGRLSVSTTHVSTTASPGMDAATLRALPACVVTSIFPERDAGCAIQIHAVNRCENCDILSSETGVGSNLNGLMNLEAFVNGAADDKFYEDVKLLVCVIGVGDLATISTRKGTSFQVVPIQVLDMSTTIIHTQTDQLSRPTPTLFSLPVELSLSSNLVNSTRLFVPNQTVLLLTSPRLQSQSRRKIKLTPRSQILINSTHLETLYLRQWINNLYPPCNISSADIECLISRIEEAKNATHLSTSHRSNEAVFTPGLGLTFQPRKIQHRKQFTWSLFTNQIALQPEVPFIAYISVIITRLSLVDLWLRNQLFCMPCSQHPGADIYSNTLLGRCDECIEAGIFLLDNDDDDTLADEEALDETHREGATVDLRFNPLLLSGVSDETGGFLIHVPRVRSPPPSTLNSSHPPSNTSTQMNLNQQRHNIYPSDKAIRSLIGLSPTDPIFSPCPSSISIHTSLDPTTNSDQKLRPDPNININIDTNTNSKIQAQILTHLQEIEDKLLYRRVTLALGWSGESIRAQQPKSQTELQHQSENNERLKEHCSNAQAQRTHDEPIKSGRIIILDVITT